MSIVIAISGWKGSGKDTAAEYLIKEYNFKKVSFATPLKDSVSVQYRIPREWCDSQTEKEMPIKSLAVQVKDSFSENTNKFLFREFRGANGQKPTSCLVQDGALFGKDDLGNQFLLYWTTRALLILEGSIKRSVDPNFWVAQAAQKCSDKSAMYVVPDLRYRSEVSGLRENLPEGVKLVTIRINRFDEVSSTDPSERDLDNYSFDHVVENRGSLSDLALKLDAIIEEEFNSYKGWTNEILSAATSKT